MASFRTLKRRLVAGLVVIAPIAVTAFVLWQLFRWLDSLVGRWIYLAIGRHIPGLGLVALFLLLLSVGWATERAVGARLLNAWHLLLARIPLISRVYSAANRIFRTTLGGADRPFREVVLVESLVPGRWSIGFVTASAPPSVQSTIPNAVTVFIPRAPNLYTGELVIVARENAIVLPLTPEEAFTFFLSAGSVSPEAGTAHADRSVRR